MAKRADRFITQVWARGWDEKPLLDPDYLWRVGSTGYSQDDEVSIRSPEDVADFRLRLEKLCVSLRSEAELNSLGHTLAYGQLKNAVRKRHALGRLWRKQPTIANASIASPIIVLGQMRSGTTRIQRLLAADPKLAGTRFCDSHDPVPANPDFRPLKARAALFVARLINPWLETLHPFGPTRTDEEIGWLGAALSPAAFEAQWRIPSYLEFSELRDAGPVYREFVRILRTDAAIRGNSHKARVIKCPQFAEDAEVLLEQFPDARIVRSHRAAKAVLDSSVSMVASQMAFQSDRHDLDALRCEWIRKMELRDRRMDTALAGFRGKSALIEFADLGRDWRGTMAAVYHRLDMDFDEVAAASMAEEIDLSRGGAHERHSNQLDELLA